MKKVKVLMGVGAFLLAGMMFTACDSSEASAEAQEQAQAVYQCPMDCEDGKTYSEEGICPVCEMDLAIVE